MQEMSERLSYRQTRFCGAGVSVRTGVLNRDETRRDSSSRVYYSTASGGVAIAAGGVGASGMSGGGVSSTPWPLQSGQELRPVVSHYSLLVYIQMRDCAELTWSMQILWNRCSHLTSFRASSSASKSQRHTRQRASRASSIVSSPSTSSAVRPDTLRTILNRPGAAATSPSLATGALAGPSMDDRSIMSSYVGESVNKLGVVSMG